MDGGAQRYTTLFKGGIFEAGSLQGMTGHFDIFVKLQFFKYVQINQKESNNYIVLLRLVIDFIFIIS